MTLAQTAVLNVGPNSGAPVTNGTAFNRYGPAIWMSGDGPGVDAQGNVYLLTGNGLFEPTLDANGFPNIGDYGNSFLKLASTHRACGRRLLRDVERGRRVGHRPRSRLRR